MHRLTIFTTAVKEQLTTRVYSIIELYNGRSGWYLAVATRTKHVIIYCTRCQVGVHESYFIVVLSVFFMCISTSCLHIAILVK